MKQRKWNPDSTSAGRRCEPILVCCYSHDWTAEVSLAAGMTFTLCFLLSPQSSSHCWREYCTCASERAALGCSGGRRFVPLRHALQQVVQTPEAARQIAQEALLPGAVLGRHACAAHVGGRVRCRVTAGVAQRLVRMGALGMTNVYWFLCVWVLFFNFDIYSIPHGLWKQYSPWHKY